MILFDSSKQMEASILVCAYPIRSMAGAVSTERPSMRKKEIHTSLRA